MKKLFYFLGFTLLFSLAAQAQNEGISFQGLARNAAGEVLVNQKISLRLSILLGSESGIAAYVETRQVTTNPQGIFAVVLGDANALTKSTNFSTINWTPAPKFIKVEMDPNGGTSYVAMGTSRLQAVPFAFHAYGVDAANVKGLLPVASGGTGVASIADLKTSLGLDTFNSAALDTKVDKVAGKVLSSNDYTTSEKNKLAGITGTNTGDQDLSSYATTSQLATKANVSDVITSLATKANVADVTISLDTKANASDVTTSLAAKANASDVTTSLATKVNASDVTTSLATKVDKVTGKELSTNDYTTAEKTKLAAITGTNTGDQVNITGNAGTATKLQSSVTINGIAFDGSANITLPASASGIPYTGATQAVDLGAYDLKVNGLTVGLGNNRVDNNVAIGQSALSSTTTGFQGNYLTAVGFEALKNDTWGYFNTGIGSSALFSNTTGLANTAVGSNSLYSNTTASYNTAVGTSALRVNTTGENNTAVGSGALEFNTTGEQNSAFGRNALSSNTTGSINTATGIGALSSNTAGGANTANGANALTSNLAGGGNTAVGNNALRNTNGSENTAIGNNAGVLNTTGTNNTAIGGYANFGANNLTNATAIGYGAVVSASNTIQLGADGTNGTTAISNVKTSGTLTAGTVTYPNTHGSANQVLSTNGSGTLAWSTSNGLPTTGNTAGDMLYWSGSAWVKVAAGTDGQTLTFIGGKPVWTGTISYANTVVNSTTGKTWMDRNLGASQVATSSTDAAAYGDLYQWGRGADGHQIRTSATTATLSSSDQPGNGNFITSSGDWRSSNNDNLWQGVSGLNNPCPTGYRIPTEAEWDAERSSWTGNNATGAFASPLKLPVAGVRIFSGSLVNVGITGYYWSSTVSSTNAKALFSFLSFAYMSTGNRAIGASVRCLKD